MTRRLNRLLMVALVAALLVVSLGIPQAKADTGSNWTGAYYNNRNLQGNPVFIRIDPALVFNWGTNSPGGGVGSSDWSARWQTIQYMNAGTYRFTITADDGVRLYIDGQLVLDAWREQAPTTYVANVQVIAGNHSIQVDYFQGVGDGSLSVSWEYVVTTSTAWTAQYFNNRDLLGAPALTRFENQINYFWGYGSPDPSIIPDNFSARWTATLPFSNATYRFTLAGNDGVRLYIDNALVINQWRDQAMTAYSIDVPLSAGTHTLRIEYYEASLEASLRFDYQVAIGLPPYGGVGTDQWYGEYFANTSLAGSPSFVRLDGQSGLNFNWSRTAPANGFPRENFSVRWTRNIFFPGRPYHFYLTVDDGARVWIDNTLIIDTWRIQAATNYSKYVEITEGFHLVRVEYYQQSLDSVVRLTWDPPNSQNPPLSVIGGVVTSPPPIGLAGTVTKANALNVRYGPGRGYNIITAIRRNDVFSILARNADASWLKVRLGNGFIGWLSSYYITVNGNAFSAPVEAPPPITVVDTGVRGKIYSGLRIRTAPNTGASILTTLSWGAVVNVLGRTSNNQWYYIEYANIKGWVYAPYVTIVAGSITNVPITG